MIKPSDVEKICTQILALSPEEIAGCNDAAEKKRLEREAAHVAATASLAASNDAPVVLSGDILTAAPTSPYTVTYSDAPDSQLSDAMVAEIKESDRMIAALAEKRRLERLAAINDESASVAAVSVGDEGLGENIVVEKIESE
jgi:hypothetical protein